MTKNLKEQPTPFQFIAVPVSRSEGADAICRHLLEKLQAGATVCPQNSRDYELLDYLYQTGQVQRQIIYFTQHGQPRGNRFAFRLRPFAVCQNCDVYTDEIKPLGAIKVCKKCFDKLETARARKAQTSFDFAGQQNTLF